MRRGILLLSLAAAVVSSCKVGPNYKRPTVAQPPQYRADPAAPPAGAPGASLGEQKWFTLFKDEKLQALIREGLAANFELKIAAARIEEARAIVSATSSPLWPRLDARGAASRQRGPSAALSSVSAIGQVSWELDIWGKTRRLTEAARAELLATEIGRDAVTQTLVTDLANYYLALRELDLELEITRESLKSREASLRLVTARKTGGVASRLEEDQAKTLVSAAAAQIAQIEQGIEQTENLISLLLGRNPGPIVRGESLTAAVPIVNVPAGLPSTLLERRPDLRIAEQDLVASNARIGAAKAAFFPSITLTGGGGWQSVQLGSLFDRQGGVYNYGGFVDLPIFDAGQRMGNYKAAKARFDQALAAYQRSIANAFRDVSDSLVGLQKSREYRFQKQAFAETLRDQSRLSELRYKGGVTSYLEVLDTERERLDAEQALAQAQRDELLYFVQLYKALGGGWQLQ